MSSVPSDVPWFVDVGRMLLAAALGALIGWERERNGREAGIRTYMGQLLARALSDLFRERSVTRAGSPLALLPESVSLEPA
ncbi:MgtC/SapB family protein [Blastomonas sp. CCH1-A6]|uniref:MgtC/SapB family protein n=1 Tax=Blastomonas sp. CCH1-A6 TaxID=1768762 RepID=UPI00406409A5